MSNNELTEDEIDAKIAEEALAEYIADGRKSCPIEKLWNEVGLAD